jgi:hypothetical protein
MKEGTTMENKLTYISGFVYQNEKDNHSFGAYTRLIKNGTITLSEANDVYIRLSTKILKDGEFIKSIKIDLSDYYEYNTNGTPITGSEEDPNARKGKNKMARYYPKENLLRIYENGYPVYENNNGIICNDPVTLADCLM